jgi:hypothetical protein
MTAGQLATVKHDPIDIKAVTQLIKNLAWEAAGT